MKKGKCIYCGGETEHEANIRCFSCDNAWQAGHEAGYKELQDKLKETTTHILRFLGLMK